MIKVLSVDNMRRSDASTIEGGISGIELMKRAGEAIFNNVEWKAPIAILCGSGNNAGDGYVVAKLLKDEGLACTLFLLSERFSADGEYYYEIAREAGVAAVICDENTNLAGYNTILDCIFGTGFKGDVKGLALDIISKINQSEAYTVSVDINSGLNGDNGICSTCVKSDLTISIGNYKSGHFLNMAKDVITDKINCDIGIEPILRPYWLLEKADVKPTLWQRKNYSNKSTYGYTAIIAGSCNYSGAAKLAEMANAALRAGTGVVKLAVPKGLVHSVLPYILESTLYPLSDNNGNFLFNEPEISDLIKSVSVVCVGMGMGLTDEVKKLVEYLLTNYHGTLIIDADGINALSRIDKSILKNALPTVILTPHIKEFSRLTGESIENIQLNPIAQAEAFASEYSVALLLKGTTTIITDGDTTYLCDKGCAGMATAGSGDVLSGIITAMCGYNAGNILLAVASGAYVNGLAGELAQKKHNAISMTASDTVKCISQAVSSIIE